MLSLLLPEKTNSKNTYCIFRKLWNPGTISVPIVSLINTFSRLHIKVTTENHVKDYLFKKIFRLFLELLLCQLNDLVYKRIRLLS